MQTKFSAVSRMRYTLKTNKISIIFWLIFSFMCSGLTGQTYNYWSWAFNTPSMMVAGAVVGGKAGPSAVYYNPALIDHENVPSLAISTSLVSLQSFSANNIAGDGIDADKLVLKVQPKFISYFMPNKNQRLGLEIAILSPVSEDLSFSIQHFDTLNILKQIQGDEVYSGYLKYNRKYNDVWFGSGCSYQLFDNFYIGGSLFISYKYLKYQFIKEARVYHQEDSVIFNGQTIPRYFAENYSTEEFNYWYLSLITKFGVQYSSPSGRLGLGANITFPAIPIYGEGDVRRTFSRGNIYDNLSDDFTDNISYVVAKENERVIVKNPFSIAAGILYFTSNKKTFISMTAEYFHGIESYSMLKENSFAGSNTDLDLPETNDFLSFYFGADAVTNVALGFGQHFSEKFSLRGGIRSDISARPNSDEVLSGNTSMAGKVRLDKYHITVGPTISIKKFDIITGLQFSHGTSGKMEQVVNYSDPVEFNSFTRQALEGNKMENAEATLNELSFLFGLIVDL